MQFPAFHINRVYNEEAQRILAAQKTSKIIHASGDIDASGDEIEKPVRDFLRRRLPSQYFVGHGHVVDQSLNVSSQFDVIIADANATPILFEGENGIQYFPWESVYAIGEIKSTYLESKEQIYKFAKSIQKLKTNLSREETPNNYIGNGITLGDGFTTNKTTPFQNPLFSFMIFCSAGDISNEGVISQYGTIHDKYLPLITAFLDGSIIVKTEVTKTDRGAEIGPISLDPFSNITREDIDWTRMLFTNEDRHGQALAVLMLGLFNHLNQCVLMRPPINKYLDKVLSVAAHQSEFVGIKRIVQFAKESDVQLPAELLQFIKDTKS